MPKKRVTISDVAKRAGVHPSTVSLALRNDPRIPEETQQRIRGIAAEIGYRPNLMARGLKGQATNTVGLLVPKLRDDFYVTLVSHQEERLRERNVTPILVVTKAREKVELPAIEELVDRGADGLIVNYEPTEPETRKRLAQAANAGMPVVMLGAPGLDGVDCVFYDTLQMGRRITEHLVSLGHRRIAVLTWSVERRRFLGYRQALDDLGIPFDPDIVFVAEESAHDIARFSEAIMTTKDRPTAVFAYDDDLAAELMNELLEAGFRIPEDISIAGFDDCWFSKFLRVPLTTMRVPQQAMAEALVDMLLNRIEERRSGPRTAPTCRTFEGEFLARASTGPPPSA